MNPTITKICHATLIALLAIPTVAVSGDWEEVDGFKDAEVAGNEIATKIVSSLKREGSTTVILERSLCQGSDVWCQSLMGSIERTMIRKGVQFLPESQRESIRNKIAEEGLYQQSSEMVSALKATEIGKQEAVQAFVTISVVADGTEKFLVEARSIRMSSGTVTIKESVRVSRKTESSTPASVYAKGIIWTSVGVGVFVLGVQQALKYKAASSESFEKYNETKDPAEAKKYREQTKQSDNYQTAAGVVAGIGICIGLYGFYQFGTGQTDVFFYRIDALSQNHESRMDIRALLASDRAGIVWSYDF